MNRRTKGFTLVELVVVMPAMFFVAAFLTAFLITLYQKTLMQNGSLELNLEAQNTLFSMRDDMFFANRFAGEVQPDATDTNAPSGGWNAIDNNALIVYEVAYDKNRQATDRQIAFKRDTPFSCSDDEVTENQFATNTMIYFVNNGTLYKRTVLPDQSGNCLATFRRPTCPKDSATSACPADIVLASNVKSMSLAYYNRSGNQMPASTLESDIDKFIQVQRTDITLTLEKIVVGDPIDATATITIKKTE